MKKDPGLIFRIVLIFSDALAVVVAFLIAYFLRVHIDSRPYYFEADLSTFLTTILFMLPFWLILHALIGLYRKNIITSRSRFSELSRLFAASIVGIMGLISYGFFTGESLLPTRAVAIYAALLCFVMLCLFRGIIHLIRNRILIHNLGTLRALVIGNNQNTAHIIEHIADYPEKGYSLAAVVSNKKYIPEEFIDLRYASLKDALEKTDIDVIFQTDEQGSEYVYGQAIKHHLYYYFVPSESALFSHIGNLQLFGDTPAILVKITPLIGGARIAKRVMDIFVSLLSLIITFIPMSIIWLIVKLSDIHYNAIYSEYRLSRYNKKVKIYKFRSMKPEYSGMSPEAAFTKMGREELIEKYRSGGDFLPNDPRITRIGRFLRATSLDELPQLFNVLRGDISLVGPRALVPGELRDYGDRSLLLSVKSGLTGLAQVSGRRDISFEERRSLDLYYVQNWSLRLDISILFRTIGTVFSRKGAK